MDGVGSVTIMTKLSKRLTAIANLVPRGDVVADIGSDHALLPVYLVVNGISPRVIAGELNAGPFEAATSQVRAAGLSDRIDVRRGDGLTVLEPGEVDTITIAGMGGALIVDILQQGLDRLTDVRSLILQPNVAEDAVRRWLAEHDYMLLDEQIIMEDGITYPILYAEHVEVRKRKSTKSSVGTAGVDGMADADGTADAGHELSPSSSSLSSLYAPRQLSCGLTVDTAMLFRFGPYLIERMEPAFVVKWQDELEKLRNIHQQITTKAGSDDAVRRLRELEQDITQIEEVLRCSRQVEK